MHEMKNGMTIERPRMVLDCGHMNCIDDSIIYSLLCCLEEALKRNGDVKLAGVPPTVASVLVKTGVGRLFEIFSTPAEAISSFSRFTAHASKPKSASKPSAYEIGIGQSSVTQIE